MPAEANRREFLKRAGLLAIAVPGAAAALDACAAVATSAKASTIRVGWAIEPDTMNPLTTYSTQAVEVLQLVYDNQIRVTDERQSTTRSWAALSLAWPGPWRQQQAHGRPGKQSALLAANRTTWIVR
jgi:ABC-type oligopeptide transport system substrate-binding subunit